MAQGKLAHNIKNTLFLIQGIPGDPGEKGMQGVTGRQGFPGDEVSEMNLILYF